MASVHVVTIEARQASERPETSPGRGAFINVYTLAESRIEAISAARREVEEAGWDFVELDSAHLVSRESFDDGSAGLEHFEQALIDGTVVVIHQYDDTN
jgi:hypothetical protein